MGNSFGPKWGFSLAIDNIYRIDVTLSEKMETNEAVQSLRLAKSYLKDVDYMLTEEAIDYVNALLDSTITNRRKSTFYEALNNINLAIKQINNAEQIDSTAHLNGNGITYFRSLSLGYRGLI